MQMAPRVSVIIPLYNHAAYIRQAILSVANQTYKNIELIIIDDGSKDNSADVAEAVLKEHPALQAQLHRQLNQGAHHTINLGLSKATGDYLTVLNSDDFYHPERFEMCIAEMQKYGAECAFSYVQHVDEAGAAVKPGDRRRAWYANSIAAENTAPSISAQLMLGNIAVSSGNIIISRRLYEKLGGYRDFKLAHDWDMLLRVVPHSEPLLVKKYLYHYRLHETNTMHSVNHLLEEETRQIFRDYALTTFVQKPENPHALSLRNWPYSYTGFNHRSVMKDAVRLLFKKPAASKMEDEVYAPIPLGSGERITLVSHDFSLSGAPRLVADIAIYLQEKGYRPFVLGIQGGGLQSELRARGIVNRAILGGRYQRMVRKMPRQLRHLFSASVVPLSAFFARGTVLLNTTVTMPILITYALLMPRKKFIWYIHESVPPSSVESSRIIGRLAQYLIPRMLKKKRLQIWFGSKSTAKIWENENRSGQVMYWSGISVRPEALTEKPIRRILTAGTVDPRKGAHYLFEAFEKCVREKRIPDDVVLTIVGFLPYYTEFGYDLIAKIFASGLQDRVELYGITQKHELDAIYDNADLYVQASIMECMPLALLTAMSRGMPVITTDVDGCLEAIPDESCGWICKPRHVESLANALTAAISTPQEAHKRGLAAKARFDTVFAREATAETLVRSLISNQ